MTIPRERAPPGPMQVGAEAGLPPNRRRKFQRRCQAAPGRCGTTDVSGNALMDLSCTEAIRPSSSADLTKRRSIEHTAHAPKLVEATWNAELRLGAQVSLIDLGIVPSGPDGAERPGVIK